MLTGDKGLSGVIGDLPSGNYRFSSYTNPQGYSRVVEHKEFQLTAGNVSIVTDSTGAQAFQAAGESVTVIPMPYRAETGALTIIKSDSQTGRPLPGATFTLQSADSGEDIFVSKTTDSEGKIVVRDIPLGTYLLWELDAPDGYVTAGSSTEIVLSQETLTVQIPNQLANEDTTGSVRLIKHDSENPGNTLSGARYDLQVPGGGGWSTFLHGFETGSNGEINIHGLPHGSYRFVETAAPSGYGIASGEGTIEFTLSASSDNPLVLRAPNTKDSTGGTSGGTTTGGGRTPGSGWQRTDSGPVTDSGGLPESGQVPVDPAPMPNTNPDTGGWILTLFRLLLLLGVGMTALGGGMLLYSRREV